MVAEVVVVVAGKQRKDEKTRHFKGFKQNLQTLHFKFSWTQSAALLRLHPPELWRGARQW